MAQLRNMTFNETFQSSLMQRNQEKFTIDRSLAQGIKENNVSKIIDDNEDGGIADKKELYDDFKEVETIVIETRKRYDEVKTCIHKTEQDIEKLKQNKDLLTFDENKFKEIMEKQKAELESTQARLQMVSDTMQSTVYRKDVYDFMKDGLKKDILVLKKRFFDRDVELMRDKTKLKTLRTDHENKIKLSKRCRAMLDTMGETVQHKQLERSSKIHSLHEVINKKQMNQRNKQIRERQIEQVMISAMTDKLADQKQWIKILSANLFLKNMLKAKMNQIIESYHPVQKSFHLIKQATSVKNSTEFIEKYFSREESYGELLENISQKQKLLEEIKEEKEQLQKKYQQNLYNSEAINEENTKSTTEMTISHNQELAIENIKERLLKISRQKHLFYGWAVKFLASYHGHPNRNKIVAKFSKSQFKQLFIEVLNVLKNFMGNLQKEENPEKKIDEVYMKNTVNSYTLSDEHFGKNTRIKTLSTYENEGNDPFEDKDMAYDDLSEMDYFQHNRRAVKKNDLQNRRFRIKTKPY